ncbi:peptidoglycan recognition family protein [Streptomyces sp. NPDC096030]|uniref:peptidoglycan recognition protein family protein n=1 Tax=Streptomyces sp. NPDC096030 TaxID=3155423 RepID=UPI00331F175C
MAIKLVRRSEWGARDYRLPSGATLYSGERRRGVKIHYLGTPYSDRTHDKCAAYVRQLQAQHMDGNGWSDIGYSFVVCTHGYVYEGRGLRRRNSANGNTTLNDQDYAVCGLVGSSGLTIPPPAQLNGLRDAVDYCRAQGPAGDWLGGHRDGYATSCPGEPLHVWVHAGGPRPNTTEENDMTPEQAKQLAEIRSLVKFGTWGYKGAGEFDAWAILNSLSTQLAAQTAAIKALAAQLGDDVDTATVVAAVERAIAEATVQVSVDVTGPANS